MAGITGMVTTYNSPNFVGELFGLTPEDTPFLSSIGGLNGGKQTTDPEFGWQTYDLRDPAANRQRLEGADAPGAEHRIREQHTNICEIHHETVNVSYTKLAATGDLAGLNTASGANPILDEEAWQVLQVVKQVKRDVEASILAGTYQRPTDNTIPRKTRGIIQAITSTVVDVAAPASGASGSVAKLEKAMVDELVAEVYTQGGIMEGESAVLMVPPAYRAAFSNLYASQFAGYQETSRNRAGVAVKTIETDFGFINLMTNRHLSTLAPNTLLCLSMEQINPVFLNVPGKGHFFLEPLAKTGASDKSQLYGEIGLAYGNERNHGKIVLAKKA